MLFKINMFDTHLKRFRFIWPAHGTASYTRRHFFEFNGLHGVGRAFF